MMLTIVQIAGNCKGEEEDFRPEANMKPTRGRGSGKGMIQIARKGIK